MTVDKIVAFARQNFIPIMHGDTAVLLEKTVAKKQPHRILEIGTAIGYSGIIMLQAAPKAILNTVEIDEQSILLAKTNFAEAGVADRVNVFFGDAREIVPKLTGMYNFIFLDGPKGQYDVFLPYLADLLEKDGVLFADNVLYKGLVQNVPQNPRHKHITIARNLNKFLSDITSDARFFTEIYNIGDGVSVSIKLT